MFPVPFPYRDGYRRTMQISGGGVVDGIDDGRITFGGTPGCVDRSPRLGYRVALR